MKSEASTAARYHRIKDRMKILPARKLLATAKDEGAQERVMQFDSLLTLLQYDTPYEVTSHHLSEGKEALDWGCGNGHFSYFLVKSGIKTTGYSFEPAPSFLHRNELFTHVEGNPNEPSVLPFPERRFDLVFSVGVLEHVYETGGSELKSLAEIHRVLRPGGKFLCFHFPNKYQWIEPFGRAFGGLEHFHKRKYTVREIRTMLSETGFDLLEWGRYNFLPRNQLRRLPSVVKENRLVVALFQAVDSFFVSLLPFVCTNFYFVAAKKGKPAAQES